MSDPVTPEPSASVAATAPAPRFAARFGLQWLEKLLDLGKRFLSAALYERLATILVVAGHVALLAAQAGCILFGLTDAIKSRLVGPFFIGLAWALGLLVLQFTAVRFLNAGHALVKSSPSRLSSAAVPDCTALVVEVAGIAWFVNMALQQDWNLFFQGLAGWLLCDAIAWVALNPVMTNVEVDAGVRAGEEAIGILSFLAKVGLKLVPFAFGVGSVIGSVMLFVGAFTMMKDADTTRALSGRTLAIFAASLPLGSYVAFALYNLSVDLMRALLVIPGKLDRLERT